MGTEWVQGIYKFRVVQYKKYYWLLIAFWFVLSTAKAQTPSYLERIDITLQKYSVGDSLDVKSLLSNEGVGFSDFKYLFRADFVPDGYGRYWAEITTRKKLNPFAHFHSEGHWDIRRRSFLSIEKYIKTHLKSKYGVFYEVKWMTDQKEVEPSFYVFIIDGKLRFLIPVIFKTF